MTDDEIICMAREAGYVITEHDSHVLYRNNNMHKFARLIQAATREECAKVCDGHAERLYQTRARAQHLQGGATGCRVCADSIRSLNTKDQPKC